MFSFVFGILARASETNADRILAAKRQANDELNTPVPGSKVAISAHGA